MSYGEYKNAGRCPGKCLYQLHKIGIPLTIVESVIFEGLNVISYCGRPFAFYQWLLGDIPVFQFTPDGRPSGRNTYNDLQERWFEFFSPELLEQVKELRVADNAFAFMSKWLPVALKRSKADGYWLTSPSRIYWVLAYDLVGEERLDCARDLISCTDESIQNSSVQDAKRIITDSYLGSTPHA